MGEQPTYQCSGCHKRFFADGFDVNRLGRRYKSCKECIARSHANAARNKCEHGRSKYQCIDCGTGHCDHGKVTSKCRVCNACEHGRCRNRCADCGNRPPRPPVATVEQCAERLHDTNLKPKLSDPDWVRGIRYGRNHLTDDELDSILAPILAALPCGDCLRAKHLGYQKCYACHPLFGKRTYGASNRHEKKGLRDRTDYSDRGFS